MMIKTLKILMTTATVFIIAALMITFLIISEFPSDTEISGCINTRLFHVFLCPSSSNYTKLNEISPNLLKTVVLTEDSTFWNHHGFDLDELQKSFKKNMEKGTYVRGGSTITQQLAKNLYLSKEKSLLRKIKEALITIRIEKSLSKKQILERYFNVVQFGKNLYGIKQASNFYFKKAPSDLSVFESTFLTFLLPSPERYSSSYFKRELTPFAERRLSQIIDNLYAYQRISSTEYSIAKNELDVFFKKASTATTLETLPMEQEPSPEFFD